MFEATDLTDYTPRETLASVGDLHALRNHIDLEILRHGHHFADLHPGPATISDHELRPGGEQSRVYGGSGCPTVAEFAVAEFGVMIGRSTASAAKYMSQALALRHRLPRTWAQVESGHATPWKACTIASACRDLSEEAAALVDSRVADIVDTLTPLRLHNIVKSALWEADPITARARAEERARERGVWAGRTDDHGTTALFIKAATGDVIRFEATVTEFANALAALGDTSPLNERRARAIGILADPTQTAGLLQIAHHLTSSNPNDSASEKTASEETASEKTVADETDVEGAAVEETDVEGAAVEETDAEDEGVDDEGMDDAGAGETSAEEWAAANPPTERPQADSGDGVPDNEPQAAFTTTETPSATHEPAASARATQPTPHRPDAEPDSDCHSGASPAESTEFDSAAHRELNGKLADITNLARQQGIKRQGNNTTLYLHITDETLLAGEGVARVEGFGPVLLTRLEELLGHNQITIKPVIDLKHALAVDAYEIPQRIREHIKLRFPAEQFVFGTGESSRAADLDHIEPFNPNGPPGQTNTDNLIPLRRFSHRVKTHGHWQVRRLTEDAVEWTTRHGFKFIVDHRGTHPVDQR